MPRRITIALGAAVLCAAVLPARADHLCPEPRWTKHAPAEYYAMKNPLARSDYDRSVVERIYSVPGASGEPACVACHGPKGNGHGLLATQFDPPPRDFTCGQVLDPVPDGQLFWVIRFGSPTASMPPHPQLTDTQIWQLVLYVRHFAGR